MNVSRIKTQYRIGWAFLAILTLGLSACLTSEAPKLAREDLREVPGLSGDYIATSFPDAEAALGAVTASGDRSYVLQIPEGDHKDAPVQLRFLDLAGGRLLAVMTEQDKPDQTMYALVTTASNGAWVFRGVDLKAEGKTRALKDALMRHGATGVTYDSSGSGEDHIAGAMSAANLRALFSDADFLAATSTDRGFRLSPSK